MVQMFVLFFVVYFFVFSAGSIKSPTIKKTSHSFALSTFQTQIASILYCYSTQFCFLRYKSVDICFDLSFKTISVKVAVQLTSL